MTQQRSIDTFQLRFGVEPTQQDRELAEALSGGIVDDTPLNRQQLLDVAKDLDEPGEKGLSQALRELAEE